MSCDGAGCERCDQGFVRLTECPLHHVNPEAIQIFRMAQAWKRGITPTEPATYLDQPARLMALIEYEQAEEDRVQAALQRRAEQQAHHHG